MEIRISAYRRQYRQQNRNLISGFQQYRRLFRKRESRFRHTVGSTDNGIGIYDLEFNNTIGFTGNINRYFDIASAVPATESEFEIRILAIPSALPETGMRFQHTVGSTGNGIGV